jgi:hypothetical protein
MVRFRNGVRQALRRAGCHAGFVCRAGFGDALMRCLQRVKQSDSAMRRPPTTTRGCEYFSRFR